MAQIILKNIRVRTIIGVFDFEREKKQELLITLKIEFDDSKASRTDNLDDTLDYKKLKNQIITAVENSSFKLLEKLSEYILDIVFSNKLVNYAKLKINKLNALRFVDAVIFVKERRKDQFGNNKIGF